MFILVHAGDDGREYALNLDNVTAVGRTINGATFINFDHNNFIRVQEKWKYPWNGLTNWKNMLWNWM